MAQLKDTVVQGSLRVTDTTYTNILDSGKAKVSGPNATTTPLSSQLIVNNPSGGAVAIELYRNPNASWQIVNDSGKLYFKNNFTTALQTTYSKTSITIDYNTGNTTFAGSVSATGGFSGSLAASNITGILGVAHGGTGADTLSADYVLVGNGTSAISSRGLKITGAAGADTIVETASGKKLTIAAGSTSYIGTAAGTSLIFRKGDTECARFNTGGMLGLNTSSTQTSHKLLVNGDSAFTGKLAFTNSANTLTEYATISYNSDNTAIAISSNTIISGNLNLYGQKVGNGRIFYGTCNSEASAEEKAVTCAEYDSLQTGDTVIVKITASANNSAAIANLKLNVNNTGAKPIKCQVVSTIGNLPAAAYLLAGGVYNFVYDGANWIMMNVNRDNDTNTYLRVYTQDTGYNDDYPILVGRTTAATFTAKANGANTSTYGVIYKTNAPTLNPSTGLMKVHQLTIGDYASFISTGLTLGNTTATSNAQNLLTLNGHMVINGSYNTSNSYSEGVRINRSSNGWADIVLGGAQGTTSGTGKGIWIIGSVSTPADATTAAASITNSQFYIAYNGASSAASRIQGHAANGYSIRPRLAVNTDVNTSYNFYVNGSTYLNGNVLSSTDNYGATLPTTNLTTGRLFFQTSPDEYELPAGGTTGQALIKLSNSDRDVTWGQVGGIMVPNTATKYYVTGSASNVQNTDPAIFDTAIYVQNHVLFGAAWNDYAEYRESKIKEPGRVVIEQGDDTLQLSLERLLPGAEIISDTYGFAIGETQNAKTPIATSGRVLAYPYEDRELFKENIGKPVCSGPSGTVSIMTQEEYEKYGYCAIGTISSVPEYEEWGEKKVKVNGRVWIRVK